MPEILVELIYARHCPNVSSARQKLKEVLASLSVSIIYREWDLAHSDNPDYVSRFGSPTILIDGFDVGGLIGGEGSACCRVYIDSTGAIKGVPAVDMISRLIERRMIEREDFDLEVEHCQR